MKKLFLCISLAFTLSLSCLAVGVIVDGVAVAFNEASGVPFVENGRTLVPLRVTMEAMGAEVDWDDTLKTAIVRKDGVTVTAAMNENCIYRNGTKIPNDAAMVVRGGRTYLPIRVVAEAFDAVVSWDGNVNISGSAADSLIYSIENSGIHVSRSALWTLWAQALSLKDSGAYSEAIKTFHQICPDFLAANDAASDAMFYKHLGECYSRSGMANEASACYKREAGFWNEISKVQETIDATRRSEIMRSNIQLFAKTSNPDYMARKVYDDVTPQPQNGLYIGAYASGDPALSGFYMDSFPSMAGKDMSAYLLYVYDYDIAAFDSHIKRAKELGKVMEIAMEPASLSSITSDHQGYINAAKYVEKSGVHCLIRFAGEMNDESAPWYTTDYELYKEKFRIVADIFHKYAPTYASMVWSPNFYPSSTIPLYYPGDEYVDYVGLSSYCNHQPETDPLGLGVDRNRWSSGLDTICSLYAYKKPIIVAEGGAPYRDRMTWADITPFASEQMYDFLTYLPIKYPFVKGFFIFDRDDGNYNLSLSANQTYLDAFKRGIKSDMYLTSPDQSLSYSYFELATNVHMEASPTELCSYIKSINHKNVAKVVYKAYGAELGSSNEIPYRINADLSSYKGITVPIEAIAYDAQGSVLASRTIYVKVD